MGGCEAGPELCFSSVEKRGYKNITDSLYIP